MRVLLTGATGYVGGRLAPRLLDAGHIVRCVVRSRRKLEARPWASDPFVEIVEADASDVDAMTEAMRGCDAAYYLIHSMQAAGADYASRDRDLAAAFATAAERARVDRIVYLGGLGEMGDGLSEHLRSRREVERVLASTTTPVTTLRAAMVIGSGSASFEILRYLVERLPVMVTPKWVNTACQPIAIRQLLRYLVQVLDTPETIGRTIDVGGPDVVTYRQLIDTMASSLGLTKRWIVPVPVLTPRLSSLWIHLVTPIDARMARPLAEGLRNRVVCRDDTAERLMPGPTIDATWAIDLAVLASLDARVASRWSDAGPIPGDPDWAGGAEFVDRRETIVDATPAATFAAVCSLGGETGYFAANWLWRLRGAMDRAVGGPGLRRGRRHPTELSYGDTVDFWRVAELTPPSRLVLRAEMRLPGVATLEFDVSPDESTGRCTLTQTARFKPRGLLGLAYWYAVTPLHGIVFNGMLRGLAERAARDRSAQAAESRILTHPMPPQGVTP
ncbi:MAG: DUF2867 domain-containing protein [Phycisphaera sp.]|nr:DUF2867 domain-containing protein [Phycisphaera sp.]